MSQYIVSARKYRPDTFETLIGQDNIAKTLKNSILRGQLAHAYLFCGPRGVGKTTTARIFAKMINCSNPSADMEPCGECESCRSFAEGRSYCIHELDAASNNSVEDIKALIDQVRVAPQVGKYSVFIVDEVHMLSQAAFNAFLKTLEEPPAHAIFILATTEKHKILPTILSRCQTYDFNRISVQDIVKNLREIAVKENITVDDESLHLVAQKADGAMRDALTIFDQTVAFCGTDIKYEDVMKNLNILSYEHSFALVENFLQGDHASALLRFDEVLSKGFNALHFISALSSHLRDLIVSKTGGLESLLELPDSLKVRYKEQADRCSLKFLYDALGITTQCESAYRASVNPRLHIEFALMKLSFLMKAPAMGATAQPVAPAAPAAPAPAPAQQPIALPDDDEIIIAEPAAAPAPAPEPKPAPAPAPRRRAAAGPAMSIKGILDNAIKTNVQETASERTTAPGEDEIRSQWQECAKIYADKPRLANTIAASELQFETEGDITRMTFLVANDAQVKWIRDYALSNLEGKLQELLQWRKIKLSVDMNPDNSTPAVAYTPEEKLKEMKEDHPEVGSLLDKLGASLK